MGYTTVALLETVGVICLAVLGMVIGRKFGTMKSKLWIVGYFVPLTLVVLISIPNYNPKVAYSFPVNILMAGRNEYALLALAITILLTTPICRLPRRSSRILIFILMCIMTVKLTVIPFAMPIFAYDELCALKTAVDSDGVCFQSNTYTCGPASAVTVLRRMGIDAEESALALAAKTTSQTGTPEDLLCEAIKERYDVNCCPVYYENIADLRGREPCIAIIKYGFLVNHYVAVLEVGTDEVVVGDPLYGRGSLKYERFKEKWLNCAIVFEK